MGLAGLRPGHRHPAKESTGGTFKNYRRAIDKLIVKHQGRVFGGAGDSVIAEFSSPVEAVRCAVEIQRDVEKRNDNLEEARRMRFRIGVNLCDVMIEGDDLLGDGVNVAARMEATAEPVAYGVACDAGQGCRMRRERCTDGLSR